jgi:hypothetical protein
LIPADSTVEHSLNKGKVVRIREVKKEISLSLLDLFPLPLDSTVCEEGYDVLRSHL